MATPLEGERDGRRVEKVKRGVEKEEREIDGDTELKHFF